MVTMTFEQLFIRTTGMPVVSDAERKRASVLIVEPDGGLKKSLRDILTTLGYGNVFDSSDHLQAIKKIEERPITHVIFEAKKTNMPAMEFLVKTLEYDQRIIAIPSSWDPSVDDVFNMLIVGARGYLVKPFTEAAVDEAVVMATKGEPISDAILYAKDRNEALASLCMTALDKLSVTIRQSRQFETAKREIPKRISAFRRAVDIGKTFADGGLYMLLESVVEFCLERGQGPATQLGRLRKRLEAKKAAILEQIKANQPEKKAPAVQKASADARKQEAALNISEQTNDTSSEPSEPEKELETEPETPISIDKSEPSPHQ